eukprot:CAMPEP_0174298452 /NCGR_PEP_ID=MMETSP0809-20121228/53791_1 /TAXON_ID=73025 ORGANISM="Eutreptiella gymnastica-like, Strain CCMP1594" /NCGR_SAMPLE_ID=MMETSP0809 /ASSEMBLY_ACC=CAM_ASM_000658 /LENGTH=114 /DNA_ID=CAMNT_0015402901 /DNA_START=457 /DNA_END=801 /DNA_ORIENTATION=-
MTLGDRQRHSISNGNSPGVAGHVVYWILSVLHSPSLLWQPNARMVEVVCSPLSPPFGPGTLILNVEHPAITLKSGSSFLVAHPTPGRKSHEQRLMNMSGMSGKPSTTRRRGDGG